MAPKKMIHDDQRRVARLRDLLSRLAADQHVQNRDILAVLSEAQRSGFLGEIKQARENDASFEAVHAHPADLDPYLGLVDEATAMHARAERAVLSSTRERLFREAEALFERAIERLDEAINSAPPQIRIAIEAGLDRPILRNADTGTIDCGPDPQSVPRKRGSRSRYARPNAKVQPVRDRLRYVKEAYLRAELSGLVPEGKPDNLDERMQRLQALVRLTRR